MNYINKDKKLLDEMKAILRRQGYAYATEKSYCDWVGRYIKLHQLKSKQALREDAEGKVEAYLTHLAAEKVVAPATQNQALNALVFLYSKVLLLPLEGVNATRSRKEPRIPVVLSKDEVKQIFMLIDGTAGLIVKMLYAGGLRISETIRLRVQDVDFGFKQITVRDGMGKKDRVTPLANEVSYLLQEHLRKVKFMHDKDLANGYCDNVVLRGP